MTKANKCTKEADTAAFSQLNWIAILTIASAYAVIAFLCTYLAQGIMQALVKVVPAQLTHGSKMAGGILPAIDLDLLLRVMFKTQYIPYLTAGLLLICYVQIGNLLLAAVPGVDFTVYEFFNVKSRQQT